LGRATDVPTEGDDAFEVMEGDAEFGFLFKAHHDGFAILEQIGIVEGDEEGVEVLAHFSEQ